MVLDKTIALFCEILGIDEDEVNKKTEFTEEYGIEPIDLAKLIIAAENKFEITIHDEDVCSFKNVGDLVDYIEKTVANY